MTMSNLFSQEDFPEEDQTPDDPMSALFSEGGIRSNDVQDPPPPPEGPPDPNSTHVPLRALEEERHRRQAAQSELDQMRQERAALNERLRMIQEQQQAAWQQQQAQANPQDNDPEPDKDEDPVGWHDWKIRRLEGKLEDQGKLLVHGFQQQQQMTRQSQEQAIISQERDMATRFAAEHPDYYQALNHLIQVRSEPYRLAGYDDQAINGFLENERMIMLAGAIQKDDQGRFVGWKHSPAERLYQMAKAAGYQAPGQGDPEAQGHSDGAAQQQTAQQQFQHPTPQAYSNPGQMTAEQRAAMARAGVRTSRGAGTTAGGGGVITLEDVNRMSTSELSEFMEKQPALLKELMGG